jgi:outer membrane protein assembly factor BamD (BamD/ComL family)
MAQQVMYVLDFYRKREHSRAVLWRADELLKKYSGLGYDEEALYSKAEAQVQLEDPQGAKETLHQLLARFPKGDYSSKAKSMINKLGPGKKPASKKAPEKAPAPKKVPKAKGAAQ